MLEFKIPTILTLFILIMFYILEIVMDSKLVLIIAINYSSQLAY